MIVTLTLNPSLDRTIEVARLERGQVLRATGARVDPGGKGVNVSRALLANGFDSLAVLPCGGDEGLHLVRLLENEGVPLRAVPIVRHTRSNVTVAEPDGTVTKINEPGPVLTPQELDAVVECLLDAAQRAEWVVVCGSLPPGLSEVDFAGLCRRLVAAGEPAADAATEAARSGTQGRSETHAHAQGPSDAPGQGRPDAHGQGRPGEAAGSGAEGQAGLRVAVDTSGGGLREAAMAGVALVKPNREELAEVVGAELRTLGDVVAAAQQLRTWGAGAVLASLGAQGAVLVDADGVISGEVPVARPRSSVGAGDALLAGFLAAGARGVQALAQALAWGAAAVSLPGSRMPGPPEVRRHNALIHPSIEEYQR